jgi:hypothetical protein
MEPILSPQGKALNDLCTEIQRQEKSMKYHADALLFALKKKEGLMICLKQLTKEIK